MLLDFFEIYDKYNLKIKGVLHIGAHYGQEDWVYRRLSVQNVIYFEPLSDNFNKLLSNITLIPDKTMAYKIALGNETKKVTMHVESSNQGMSSSILKPLLHIERYPHIVFDSEEEVDMKRLDDIDFDREKFNLINIDVQGYELEVFKGAEKTLENIDIIISEVNKDYLYENGALLDDLISYLEPYGFEFKECNWAGEIWGDGLFIKNKTK
jgi:FkbM family methyltransferase